MFSLDQQKELQGIAKGVLRFNEPMSEHTTIKIGGPADVWFEPVNVEDLANTIKWIDDHDISRMIFGNGSNVLVRDKGIRGVVISLKNLNQIVRDGNIVKVESGVPLGQLVSWSIENSLSGLESLTLIPGTVGGAIIMNAGTKEGTIGDRIKSLKWLSKVRISTVSSSDLNFSYRKLKMPKGVIIIEADLELATGDRQEIESKVEKIKSRRKEIQPLIWPSLGSVFKNPEKAQAAWQLIDDCNMRGVRVGGARISNEHANWIINEGSATAKDVEVLIKMIKEHVKDKSDVNLEPEIILVGE